MELSQQSCAHVVDLIFKKCKKTFEWFYDFMCHRALATVSHTFCRPHLQKVVLSRQFFTILMWDRALASVLCTFCRSCVQKVVRTCQFFALSMWKSSSRFSLVHISSTSSSKSGPNPVSYWRYLCEIELSQQSCAHVSTSSSKSGPIPPVFYDFNVRSSSRFGLVHILSILCSKSGPNLSVFCAFYVEIELSLQSRAHFVDLIFKKWSEPVSFFLAFSLVHILSISSSKIGPNPSVIDDIYVKSSSRNSLVHMCRPHFQKSAKKKRQFFTIFVWNQALATVLCTCCRPHLQKVQKKLWVVLRFLCEIEWNRTLATLSCTCCRPQLQKVQTNYTIISLQFLCEIKLSLQSRAHFVDLIFKQWSKPVSFLRFFCETKLAVYWAASCTFCRPLSGSRRAPAETLTLQRGPRTATLPEKITGFCTRECFQPWIHAFSIAHTSNYTWWWCDWHDDVVDMMIEMMMWLPWWWDS